MVVNSFLIILNFIGNALLKKGNKKPRDFNCITTHAPSKPRHPHSRPKEVEDNTVKLNKERKDTLVVSESDYADFLKWQKQLNKKQSEDEM